MPNWVFNKVRIFGTERQLARVKRALRTNSRARQIREASGKASGRIPLCEWETRDRWKEQLEHLKKQDKSCFDQVFDFNKIVRMPDDGPDFDAGRGAPRPDAADNWYDWSIRNWGTKWNACEAMLVDDCPDMLEYEFETAWAPPLNALLVLSARYHVGVKCLYYDSDDFPNMAGCYEADHGKAMHDPHNGDLDWISGEFGPEVVEDAGYEWTDSGWRPQGEEEEQELEEGQGVN